MLERYLRMLCERICMALLSMFNGGLGVFHGLRDVLIAATGHSGRADSKAKRHSGYHNRDSVHPALPV
jgi:hypothetical protein